jgi:hypothetical protein
MKYLLPVAVIILAGFAVVLLITVKPSLNVAKPLPHPGYEEPPGYWEGVSIEQMGFELTPYCDPLQVSGAPYNKKIPAIAVSGGIGGTPYIARVIWTEREGESREIWESVGLIDGDGFSPPYRVSELDGYKSFNPVAVTGALKTYLGFMDESVNTREIWFRAGDTSGWSEPEPVSGLDIDSRSWGANPMAFYDSRKVIELPLMLWFDHRFTKHEILFNTRVGGVALSPDGDSFELEEGEWGDVVRATQDEWFQFDPHADWSSSLEDLSDNVIHLVYMDSRYGSQEDKHTQHEGNGEIFYRSIRPDGAVVETDQSGRRIYANPGWVISDEIQLSFTEGLSDLPRVCGKRYVGNEDLDTTAIVWHELDMNGGMSDVYFCTVKDGERGDYHQLNSPGTVALNPEIISIPFTGHEDLKAVAYQQYQEGEKFPLGKSDIYMRLIDGETISEPIRISDSEYTCSYPRMAKPGFKLGSDVPLLVAWSEYRAGKPDLTGESQIFFRSFLIREIPEWPPESQTYRREGESTPGT